MTSYRSPKALSLVVLLVASLVGVGPVAAQDSSLLLEIGGGLSVPVGSFGDGTAPGERAEAGPSLSVVFVAPGVGWRGLYVGFSQHRFACEDAGCSPDGRLVATGFDFGLRITPLRGGFAVPWVRLGGITTRVETDDLGGANVGVSDLGFGGEIGVGLYLGGQGTIAIDPQIRYAMVGSQLPGGSKLDMRYLIAELTLVLAF